MNKEKLILLSGFLVFIILISGCTQDTQKPAEGGQDQQPPQPKTEIKTSQGDTEMIISPSEDNKIKDIVTMTLTKVPAGTKAVFFAIQGRGIEDLGKTGPNLGYDADDSDGWSFILDTMNYENGVYSIYAFAVSENQKEGPPLGGVQAQVIIQNEIENESKQEKTEIKVSQGDMKMIISPSKGNVVSSIVSINLPKVPKDTGTVAFAIQGPGISDLEKTGPNLGTDSDSSDGWGIDFDTVVYPDGEYTIHVFTSNISSLEEASESDSPPTGVLQTTIKIKNEEAEDLGPPKINFYKGIDIWPTGKTKEKIIEVKNTGASVVGFFVIAGYENDKIILSDDWDISLKRDIREAYRNGLAVSVSVLFPHDIDKKFPYREGSDIDLPPGYDLDPLIKNLKEVYKELAISAEENKVHNIIIPLEIEALIGRVYENSDEYWKQSSKINQELTKEIRKYYSGEIVGVILGGAWGFDAPCCYTNVPIDKIDLSGFDALSMGTGSDYRTTGSSLGYVEEGLKRIEFTRKIADKNNVKKIYAGVGGYPLISPWKGDRVKLYSEFFEKSQGKTDGYSVAILPELPESIYDNKSAEAAKIWYKKIGA